MADKTANIKIKKFDMNLIKTGKVIVIIGKRATGHDKLIKDILYNVKDIPNGTIISPIEDVNGFYSNIVPSLVIHNEYNNSIINNCIKRQTNMNRRHTFYSRRFGNRDINPDAFILFNQCFHNPRWTYDKALSYFFLEKSHNKLLSIFNLQYPNFILPHLSVHIDYIFIFKDNNMTNRKKLYEYYGIVCPNFKEFCKIMDLCTENNECLVIKNKTTSNLKDIIYWYKPNVNIPEFKIDS